MVNRKLNKKKLVIFIFMIIVIIVLAIGGVCFSFLSAKDKNGETIDYQVTMGSTVYGVFDDLENKGIIKSSLFMKLYSLSVLLAIMIIWYFLATKIDNIHYI